MMIPLPSPPTDNLYKFLALGGLSLAIVCLVCISLTVEKTTQHAAARWKEEGETIRNILYRAAELAEAVNKIDVTKPGYAGETEVVAKAMLTTLQMIESEFAFTRQQTEFIGEQAAETGTKLRWCAWGGLSISMLGFLLWYRRVQRIQDHLLSLEYKAKLRDTDTQKKGKSQSDVGSQNKPQ